MSETHLNNHHPRQTGANMNLVVFYQGEEYFVTSINMNYSESLKSLSQSVFVYWWEVRFNIHSITLRSYYTE